MKLEIKHLAPYLPYKVPIKHRNAMNDILVGRHLDEVNYYFNEQHPNPRCMLILRPLRWLTKEIEHGGKKFEPRKELYLHAHRFLKTRDKVVSVEFGKRETNYFNERLYYAWRVSMKYLLSDGKESGMAGTFSMQSMELEQWLKLFEWHFDVFGLIPKGLATIKT